MKKLGKRAKAVRTSFPYAKVAKMWEWGKTIATIAHSIGRVDNDNPKDQYHSLRNFLMRMHKGYSDGKGKLVTLPYRVSKKTVQRARKAGSLAWSVA